MIIRKINIKELIQRGKVLIIYGARRTGKTTLLNEYLKETDLKYKLESGDNIRVQQVLSSQDFSQINDYVSDYDLIAIDEAQQIPNIGMGLKIIVDNHPEIFVIVTGSSSFDLSQTIGEPLTGRKRTSTLYTFSQEELLSKYNKFELKEELKNFLIFGLFPEVALAGKKEEKIEIINELVNSYLLKDILSFERVKSHKHLLDLLKLLAFQVGSEVSQNELAVNLGVDVKTVGRYLDLLEKSFIIKKLGGFSRNLRNEITSKAKYYFCDNGIRNGIIMNFNSIDLRNDIGQLFENFMFIERQKFHSNKRDVFGSYFWRTYTGKEIDLIEDKDGKITAFEFKWSKKARTKKQKEFVDNYNPENYYFVNESNYLDYLIE